MRSRRSIPDSQLQKLVRRLLRINRPDTDTPVMISTMDGDYCSSVGRLLQRGGARLSALVDIALERERAVKVFLPENALCGRDRELFGARRAIRSRTRPDPVSRRLSSSGLHRIAGAQASQARNSRGKRLQLF